VAYGYQLGANSAGEVAHIAELFGIDSLDAQGPVGGWRNSSAVATGDVLRAAGSHPEGAVVPDEGAERGSPVPACPSPPGGSRSSEPVLDSGQPAPAGGPDRHLTPVAGRSRLKPQG
jgi:hypothetical protein